jgi:hypothetical protein
MLKGSESLRHSMQQLRVKKGLLGKLLIHGLILWLGTLILAKAEPVSAATQQARCYERKASSQSCIYSGRPPIRSALAVSPHGLSKARETMLIRGAYCERMPDYCPASDWNY